MESGQGETMEHVHRLSVFRLPDRRLGGGKKDTELLDRDSRPALEPRDRLLEWQLSAG